jgi:hypothetical protein
MLVAVIIGVDDGRLTPGEVSERIDCLQPRGRPRGNPCRQGKKSGMEQDSETGAMGDSARLLMRNVDDRLSAIESLDVQERTEQDMARLEGVGSDEESSCVVERTRVIDPWIDVVGPRCLGGNVGHVCRLFDKVNGCRPPLYSPGRISSSLPCWSDSVLGYRNRGCNPLARCRGRARTLRSIH